MGLKVVITGTTGMLGKGTLIECLESDEVDSVLSITRSSLKMKHPKLEELIVSDLMSINKHKDQLKDIDACFYCMGVSAAGLKEETYTHLTYHFAKAFADILFKVSPDAVFNYVSGMGTDSTEKGRTMWARVKGKTENTILQMGFRDAYAFRPGMIIPEKGVTSSTRWYRYMYAITRPLFPIFKRMDSVVGSSDIGKAMIQIALQPQTEKVLNPPDINSLSKSLSSSYKVPK